MNVEILGARVQELDNAILNVTAQLNALHGHKAETTHWLQQLNSQGAHMDANQIESSIEIAV